MRCSGRHLCFLAAACLLAGCGAQPSAPPAANANFYGSPLLLLKDHSLPATPAGTSPFIRGVAKVVSVDPDMGQAVLEIGGQEVEAYWETQWATAQAGTTVPQDGNRANVGVYRQPEVKGSSFDAHPGDMISFMGMRTGNSVLLTGISVITP